MRSAIILPVIFALGAVVVSSMFIVDERKQALVLQFGQVKQVVREPGLGFKIPFIQDVVKYERRILSLDTDEIEVTPSDDRRLVVDAFARPLQGQERLTAQIRDCIQYTLKPMGVAVVLECAHLCMQMRGIQKQNSVTTTSAFTGIFLNDPRTREEFIKLIGARLH